MFQVLYVLLCHNTLDVITNLYYYVKTEKGTLNLIVLRESGPWVILLRSMVKHLAYYALLKEYNNCHYQAKHL